MKPRRERWAWIARMWLAVVVAVAPRAARGDVPSHKVFITNSVEVDGQERFPDWVVLVFPGGPPSGRPVAWPSLVEPGYQTTIDRKTLGTPRLWILPRAALDELAVAARDNDDQVDGPVAELLEAKGVECAKVDLVDSANLVNTTPEQRLVKYLVEDAAPGRCAMKRMSADYTNEEMKRPPSWARFAPRKRKADAGGPAATASAPATPDPPVASTAPSASAPAAKPATSATATREPPVPEPAKGCACAVAGEWSGAAGGIASLAVLGGAIAVGASRRRRGGARSRHGSSRPLV